MNGGLDPHFRAIDRSSDHHVEDNPSAFSFQPARPRSATWGLGPGARLPVEEPILFDEIGQFGGRDPTSFEYARQPLLLANDGPKRLSLAPRNIYKTQQNNDTGPLSNADNHFKFSQNLRHGVSMNPRQPLINATEDLSPISQLATGMIQNTVLRGSLSRSNFSQGVQPDRFKQLQPPKQQFTPPFNLRGGYIYSPNVAQPSALSSPLDAPNSSPTAMVSLRRATSRTLPVSEHVEGYKEPTIHSRLPETPQRQTARPAESFSKATPQSLSLGHAPPMAHGIQLVSPHELPDRFRQVFPYELFNAPQSKCFASIYKTNDNIVISAPTGSGKTAMLELAICKLVEGYGSGEFKIVYQAPTKSLCAERMRDWVKKFSHLNLPCAELTGDTNQFEMSKVRNATIIITTPEKWDSITRKWSDFSRLLQMVKLFLIDEVHTLKDTRGATLEAVVSRMKTSGVNVRFIALSATVPNSNDIATWLGKNPTDTQLPALRETFGEDFRPVKLQKHVHGFDGTMNDFAFDKVLAGKLPGLIQRYTHKKPIMIFCFTRKSCEQTAEIMAENWTRQRVVDRAWPAPTHRTALGTKELQNLASCGVAFHHAGLDLQDRNAIEAAYLKGDISLLCCTSTLAVGVNLPCHLVVLKGTVGFQDGGMTEYGDMEVMQMLGRAGRPQFDDSAVAIILTRSKHVEQYKKMITGQEILESTLHLNLIEHLNSEIGLSTIRNLHGAQNWLAGTFLSVRMRKNPSYYKLDGIGPMRDTDERLKLVCERDVKLLQDNELVTLGDAFKCTEYGHAMSRYMVQFDTMKLLLSLPVHAKTEEILQFLCQASELKDLRIKPTERAVLRELNKSPFIKYPVKENVATTAHKVFIMIQAQLGGVDVVEVKDFALIRRQYMVDQAIIFDRCGRLIRCIVDCKAVDCDAISTRHALDLARSFSASFWENSNLQLRQIPTIGPAATRRFVASNVNSIEKLADLDTATLERIMTRNPPFGRKMLDSLAAFPRLTLASQIVGRIQHKPGSNPKVKIKSILGYRNNKTPIWKGSKPSLTFMAETSDGVLVHFWRGNIQKLTHGQELKFDVELSGPEVTIKCCIACDDLVGTLISFRLNPGLSVSDFPPPKPAKPAPRTQIKTELEDEDEFDTDGLEDDEMLAVADHINVDSASDYGSDGFADVDELVNNFDGALPRREVSEEAMIPSQMENGKWSCKHLCRDGQLLKNGHTCKHKCCHEGLDKPPKPKKKQLKDTDDSVAKIEKVAVAKDHGVKSEPMRKSSSKDTTNARTSGSSDSTKNAKGAKNSKKSLQKKLLLFKSDDTDSDRMEVVDFAREGKAVEYSDVAPHDYRKLHSLHTKVQGDKPLRLPKQKAQFSYTNGEEPDLPFLNGKSEVQADDLDSDSDFPTFSKVLSENQNSPSAPTGFHGEQPNFSSQVDDSLESLEEAMIGMEDSMRLQKSPTPKVDSGFANEVFNFAAFDDNPEEDEGYTSPLMQRGTNKRSHSTTPEVSGVKYRRLKKDESATAKDTFLITNRSLKEPVETEPVIQDDPYPQSHPSWVNEMDPSFIDSLKDFVDFID